MTKFSSNSQVRLCHKEQLTSVRTVAAETLAYLTEVDTELQRLASISNHLIPTLASFLRAATTETPQNQQEMRQAAFRVSLITFIVFVFVFCFSLLVAYGKDLEFVNNY